ncbi:hypothetical protein BTH41_00261 [Bacillus mycoides]|nr:hypothetical protein BTH41_00261 [Bacillus mycoides]
MKTKRENKCGSLFVLHSSGLYVEKSKWIYRDYKKYGNESDLLI